MDLWVRSFEFRGNHVRYFGFPGESRECRSGMFTNTLDRVFLSLSISAPWRRKYTSHSLLIGAHTEHLLFGIPLEVRLSRFGWGPRSHKMASLYFDRTITIIPASFWFFGFSGIVRIFGATFGVSSGVDGCFVWIAMFFGIAENTRCIRNNRYGNSTCFTCVNLTTVSIRAAQVSRFVPYGLFIASLPFTDPPTLLFDWCLALLKYWWFTAHGFNLYTAEFRSRYGLIRAGKGQKHRRGVEETCIQIEWSLTLFSQGSWKLSFAPYDTIPETIFLLVYKLFVTVFIGEEVVYNYNFSFITVNEMISPVSVKNILNLMA